MVKHKGGLPMSVRIERIEKDGSKWAVCGSTEGELEMGISALQKSLHKAEEKPKPKGPGRPPHQAVPREQQRKEKRQRVAIGLLRAIRDAPADGADSSALTTAIGIEPGSKALGSLVAMVERLVQ